MILIRICQFIASVPFYTNSVGFVRNRVIAFTRGSYSGGLDSSFSEGLKRRIPVIKSAKEVAGRRHQTRCVRR